MIINNNRKLSALYKLFIVALLIMTGVQTDVFAQKSVFPSLGGSRSGTSGFQYLKINIDARSAAMGGSNVADAFDASSLYSNPALAVQSTKSQAYLSHTSYFVDIAMNYAGYVHKMNTIALGGSLMYLDSGEMDETTEFSKFGTGRTFRTTHLAAGLTFSQELSELFSYGISTKYIEESIEEVSSQSVVFDIGFFYKVGETGMRFAVGLNNFGIDATPSGETTRQTRDGEVTEDDFEDVSPPTIFQIGLAYDLYKKENFDMVLTGQLTNPSDNSERISIGSEIKYLDRIFFRTGYEFGIDENKLPTAGVGYVFPVSNNNIYIDYGFTNRDRLGNIHRFTLKFDL